MNDTEKNAITQDEHKFRIHVTETLTRVDERTLHMLESIGTLRSQNVDQFDRIGKLERQPRKITATAAGIATGVGAAFIALIEGIKKIIE